MNPQEIQRLLDFLNRLEQQLGQAGRATDGFRNNLNSLREGLRGLLESGAVQDVRVLNDAFNAFIITLNRMYQAVPSARSQIASMRSDILALNSALKSLTARGAEPLSGIPLGGAGGGVVSAERAQEALTNLRRIHGQETRITEEVKRQTQAQRELAAQIRARFEATQDRVLGTGRRSITSQFEAGIVPDTGTVETADASLRNLQEAVEPLGFSLADLQTHTTDVNSGLSAFSFRSEDAAGRTRVLSGQVDQLGRITFQSTGRMRSFGDLVRRNIVEVAKWSIAVGIVYGSIAKLGEILEATIENEVKLAEITIVLGNAQTEVNEIFSAAVQIARETGSAVTGVLDSYADAIRVTASITDETERFRTANQLLEDSLILAKLGTIDQAQAMDLLIASLNQSESPLQNGTELLDKWVATSNAAGVTLEDLSTAYSITAGAAKAAGIEVGGANDELSAIIATIAESFPYEGRELGNRIRALISGIGDPARQQELFNLGISPVDAENQVRDFLDIYEEVAERFRQGIISEAEVGQIAGGNARERNIIIEFVRNLSRVQQINASSADAQGAAQSALGEQLETVRTSLDRMQTSFVSLGQTLGTEGGFLETVTSLIDGLSSLVDLINTLVSVTGTAGPALALILGLNNLSGSFGRGGTILGGIAGAASGLLGGSRSATGGQGAFKLDSGAASAAGTTMGISFANRVGAVVPGILVSGLIAGLSGETDTLGASIGGAIVGGMLTGSPVGAVIGSQIASGLANAFIANESVQFANTLSEVVAQSLREGIEDLDAGEDQERSQREQLNEEFNRILQDNTTTLERTLNQFLVGFGRTITNSIVNPVREQFGLESIGPELPEGAAERGGLIRAAQLQGRLSPEELSRLQEIVSLMEDLESETLESEEAVRQLSGAVENINSQSIEDLRQELLQAVTSGDISYADYFDLTDTIDRLPEQIATITEVIGEELIQGLSDVGSQEELFESLFDFLIRAPVEVRNRITALVGEVSRGTGDLDRILNEFVLLYENIERQSFIDPADFDAPQIFDVSELTADEFELVLQEMEILAANYAVAISEILGPGMGQQIVDGLKETVLLQADEIFRPLEEAYPQFLNTAIRNVKQQTSRGGGTSVGFQELDIPSSQFGEIRSAMDYFARELGKLGFQPDPQPTVIRFADDIIQVKDVDSQLLRLAMNELIEVNRDQLEGIYNLPTDASFFVPFTGYQLGFGQEGQGGLGSLPTVDLAGSDRIEAAGGTMLNAGNLMLQAAGLLNQASQQPQTAAGGFEDFLYGPNSYLEYLQGPTSYEPLNPTKFGTSGLRKAPKGGYDSLESGKIFEQFNQINQAILTTLQSNRVQDVPSLELNLNMQATLQTLLDGRLVANQIKNFLVSDLLRFQGSGGGATISYVV